MPVSPHARQRSIAAVLASIGLALVFCSSFDAGSAGAAPSGGCAPKSKTCDKTTPTVAITAPIAAAAVSGTISITGTSSDNAAVSAVAVAVDGGSWQNAIGTTTWSRSWNTTALANGSHTLSARATDGSGNTKV